MAEELGGVCPGLSPTRVGQPRRVPRQGPAGGGPRQGEAPFWEEVRRKDPKRQSEFCLFADHGENGKTR